MEIIVTYIINSIITPVVQTIMVPCTDKVGYLISSAKYVRIMHTKKEELDRARLGIEDYVKWNTGNDLQVSDQVRDWLEEVSKINAEVDKITSDVGRCFNLKLRYKLGKKAIMITVQIVSYTSSHSALILSAHPVPLGKVNSSKASTSTSFRDLPNDFNSRDQTLREALKALEPNHETHMVALWGMGGVGKTTMMQRLKQVVIGKKMFDFFVEIDIGEKTNPINIQEAVANYLGIELRESVKQARADKLRKTFEARSNGGEIKNLLIILDDVWELVNLNDIGLSPLPNIGGVNFKVLLTSRNKRVCFDMGAKANSNFEVSFLTEAEGRILFRQIVEAPDLDPELYKIGDIIASRCGGLPMAIKTIASTLQGRNKRTWTDAVSRLKHHNILENTVREVFRISYDNLRDEETKSVFLLCGLFPEDYDVPNEELVRYGWGLKLFTHVNTIREARDRLYTCTERLRETNLLIESDDGGCVKMHDLVRTFALYMFSEAEHASMVNHGSWSGWPENDMSDSCKRISLTCKGMHELPTYLNNFPSLPLLKLMHGDNSLRFPQDFYGDKVKLQVISYDKMMYPMLPSYQCSTNLRVLHLHECTLRMFDCSSIGNLSNLEVLSFANSSIDWLPATIGNLKKLRLLDLTDCHGLCIDKGVVENLVKLEELYAGVRRQKAITFTYSNCYEMAKISKNLSVLEIQFSGNNLQPAKNMSFENLEQFKISVGRSLDGSYSKGKHSIENTLQLVTKKDEVFDFGLNELFVKTEVLCLSIDDVNDLSDVELNPSHSPRPASFTKLRVLVISNCAKLRYLFTLFVAKDLSNLERLEVDSCENMEELVCTEGGGENTVTFPKLKFLSLCGLPNITSIFPTNVLPSVCLLKEEVVIPKLEKLSIDYMKNLKDMWPYEHSPSNKVNLREILVSNCDDLVNLFPCNPMPLLHHLEELKVEKCGSVEVLFNIDLDSVGETEEGTISSLRIKVDGLEKLEDVWRIKGENNSRFLNHSFQAVESIKIERCKRFRNVFSPTTTNFDLEALTEMYVNGCKRERGRNNELEGCSQTVPQVGGVCWPLCLRSKEKYISKSAASESVIPSNEVPQVRGVFWPLCLYSKEIYISKSAALASVIPSYAVGQMQNLQVLKLISCISIKEVFGTIEGINKSGSLKLPKLKILEIINCGLLEHVFTFFAVESLKQLEELKILSCKSMKVVVKKEDEQPSTSTSEVVFDRLNSISLVNLTNLEGFFLGMNEFKWPLLEKVIIINCPKMTVFGPGGSKTPKLKYIQTNIGRHSPQCGLNFHATTNGHHQTPFKSPCPATSEGMPWSFHSLIEIDVESSYHVEKFIPSNELLQLQKLKKIHVKENKSVIEVFEVFKGTNIGFDEPQTVVQLPHLSEVQLNGLTRLRYIWKSNFWTVYQFPNLTRILIDRCERLEYVFTSSMAGSLLQLKELYVSDCKYMKEVIFWDDGVDVGLRHLKSLTLHSLPHLEGFCLGVIEFSFQSLNILSIGKCPAIKNFTKGIVTTPQLKEIETTSESLDAAGRDINSVINNNQSKFR